MFETMKRIEDIYVYHGGKIHVIMNHYDLSSDDFKYLIELKEYYNE